MSDPYTDQAKVLASLSAENGLLRVEIELLIAALEAVVRRYEIDGRGGPPSEPLRGPAAVFEQMWLSSEKECEQLRAIRDGCERMFQERAAQIERLSSTLVTDRDMDDARKLARHLDVEDHEGEDVHDIAQAIADGRRKTLEGK